MFKNYSPGLWVAATLITLIVTGPAMAQDSQRTGQGTDSSTGTTTSYQQPERSDNNNWGWLGLAGLAGLAGLRRPAPTVVAHETKEREGKARTY